MAEGRNGRSIGSWILIAGEIAIVFAVVYWMVNHDWNGDKGDRKPAPAETEHAAATDPAAAAEPTRRVAGAAEGAPEAVDERATASGAEAGGTASEPLSFDVVRVDAEGNALVAGRAAAGSEVSVLVEGKEAARAVAGPEGDFAALFDLPPSGSARTLSLAMDLGDGPRVTSPATAILAPAETGQPAGQAAASEPSEAARGVSAQPRTEPAVAPRADAGSAAAERQADPAFVSAAAGADDRETDAPDRTADALAVPPADRTTAVAAGPPESVSDGAAPFPAAAPARAPAVMLSDAGGVRLLQAPGDDLPPEIAGVLIEAVSYDAGGAVLLSGRGRAGAPLRLYLDNAVIADARVGARGLWNVRVPGLAPGVYTLRADQLKDDGSVDARFETPFQREHPEEIVAAADRVVPAGSPETPQARVITVQPGFTLWGIADRTYGSGFQYVKIYRANRDQIRDPDLIYPGQVFALPEGD